MLFDGDQTKIDAYNKLIALGVFIPLKNVDLYHGRVNTTGEQWQVVKDFDNAGNKTGNQNLNKIPALHVADQEIAEEFAQERTRQSRLKAGDKQADYKPEVHKIISSDDYAVCIDMNKHELLQTEEVKKLIQVLIFPGISKNAVEVPFISQKTFQKVSDDLKRSQLMNDYVPDTSVKILARIKNYNEEEKNFAIEIAKSINSRVKLMDDMFSSLEMYLDANLETDYNSLTIHFSSAYFSSFLAENHIAGICRTIKSATICQVVEAFQLFDLDRINTERIVGDQLRQATETYSLISQEIKKKINNQKVEQMLSKSPEGIIKSIIEKSPSIKEQFESDPGLWEGFNLGEHTESVLRFFEENFSKTLPYDTKIFVNLIILMHDIGKASSFSQDIERGTIKDVENYKTYAKILCKDLGINEQLADFIIDFTTKSQKHTSAYYINNDDSAISKLEKECQDLLKQYNMSTDKDAVFGLMQIARIIQTCDSGAYTFYGKTRNWDTSEYYNNGNERWTKGFVKTPRGYRFKKDAEVKQNNLDRRNISLRERFLSQGL